MPASINSLFSLFCLSEWIFFCLLFFSFFKSNDGDGYEATSTLTAAVHNAVSSCLEMCMNMIHNLLSSINMKQLEVFYIHCIQCNDHSCSHFPGITPSSTHTAPDSSDCYMNYRTYDWNSLIRWTVLENLDDQSALATFSPSGQITTWAVIQHRLNYVQLQVHFWDRSDSYDQEVINLSRLQLHYYTGVGGCFPIW